MTDRLRPLIIAEAANPEWVSVPLVGWSLASALREVTDAHIVTQVRNRDAFLRAGLTEIEDFTAIDNEHVARRVYQASNILRMGKGKGWTTSTALESLSYPSFEAGVWRAFGDDIKAGRFDLVHRVTPLTPTLVSPIAAKCKAAGVPFVMGPINGGVPWPPGFDGERRREREWLSYVRGAYKLMPGRTGMIRSASAIIAGSRHTMGEYPDWAQDKCIYIPENAIDPARFQGAARTTPNQPLVGCFIGRMVPYKGPDMLIEAAAPLLRQGRLRLEMMGDGPMLDDLKALAAREGVADSVTFHGWVEHANMQDLVRRADLLTFPSVREFGGGVVLEAMALGLVPMVVAYGGPGELVDDTVGVSQPMGARAEIIAGFGALLEGAVNAPEALPALSQAAIQRVEDKFTWARKAEQILGVYDWVLNGGDRPAPFG